jgi:predicted O-methyltransferase YrrM
LSVDTVKRLTLEAVRRRILRRQHPVSDPLLADTGASIARMPDAEALFKGLYRGEIRLGRIGWEWGDMYNDAALMFLCCLAGRAQGPIIEFGTHRGRTTYNLALNSNVEVITIDADLEDKEANIAGHEYGLREVGSVFLHDPDAASSRIRMIRMDSRVVDLTSLRGSASLVLVDGGHSYEVCSSDSRMALQLLHPGGLAAWDDYGGYWPGAKRAIDELAHQVELVYLEREGLVVYVAPQVR